MGCVQRQAGTRQAASTLAARLAPRHPRQACRPTFYSHFTHAPRLRAPPAEGRAQRGCRSRSASTHHPPTAAAGQPDATQRAQQAEQLVGGGQRVVARAAWTSCLGVQQCTACFGVHAVASECTGVKSACFGVHRGALENSNGKLKNPDALKIHFSPTVTPARPDLRFTPHTPPPPPPPRQPQKCMLRS